MEGEDQRAGDGGEKGEQRHGGVRGKKIALTNGDDERKRENEPALQEMWIHL